MCHSVPAQLSCFWCDCIWMLFAWILCLFSWCQRETCNSQTIQIQPTTSCQLWQRNLRCLQTRTMLPQARDADHPQHRWVNQWQKSQLSMSFQWCIVNGCLLLFFLLVSFEFLSSLQLMQMSRAQGLTQIASILLQQKITFWFNCLIPIPSETSDLATTFQFEATIMWARADCHDILDVVFCPPINDSL